VLMRLAGVSQVTVDRVEPSSMIQVGATTVRIPDTPSHWKPLAPTSSCCHAVSRQHMLGAVACPELMCAAD
jgi:hypothetical protein